MYIMGYASKWMGVLTTGIGSKLHNDVGMDRTGRKKQ